MKSAPTFPPLLSGHRAAVTKKPSCVARSMAEKGKASAGDLYWSESQNRLEFSLVLEPEVDRLRCSEMVALFMVAFGDAAGAICPPEVAITYRWPGDILINDARAGGVDVLLADGSGIPNWMVVSLGVQIRPENLLNDPGFEADVTTLWDEGCGNISRTQLLESVARHLVNWLHTWEEEGFKPVHDQWTGRLCSNQKLSPAIADAGDYLGLDENGNCVVALGEERIILDTIDALGKVRVLADASS